MMYNVSPSSFCKPLFAFVLCALGASACGGQNPDGGSDERRSAEGPPAASSGPGAAPPASEGAPTVAPIANRPLEGTIGGKPFLPQSIQLKYSKAEAQWRLILRNYASDCGDYGLSSSERANMQVEIGAVEPRTGTQTIAYGDGHGAGFDFISDSADGSVGIGPVAREGTLRLDSWSDTPQSTIAGGLRLVAGDNVVDGTFTATVCPPP